jgi:hypothetical protein
MRCLRAAAAYCAALLACAAAALLLSARASEAQVDTLGAARSPLQHGRAAGGADLYTYRIVKSYPHDPKCFTQGLVVRAARRGVRRNARMRACVRRCALGLATLRCAAPRARAARASPLPARPAARLACVLARACLRGA